MMSELAVLQTPAAAALLHWYDRHRRSMPWRALPGEAVDPYRVWLSEIMLQQTTVAAVCPYFDRFMTRFPTIEALADAPAADVMEAWSGLGYYARARNLHACAKQVAERGGFPRDVGGLQALPGIGLYTSAAIASIAFQIPVVPIDGNVERVVTRLFNIAEPLPTAKKAVAEGAGRLGKDPAAQARAADFTQALFDLGATICTPRNPACGLCPWRDSCRARLYGDPESLPRKGARKKRPVRHGAQFWLQDKDGRVLLRRRPPSGLLGGMLELPGTVWREHPWPPAEALDLSPQRAVWSGVGEAVQGFTHFELRLSVYAATVETISAEGELYCLESLEGAALPAIMRRCVALGRAGQASTEAVGNPTGPPQFLVHR